jgi:hypothetical protein
MSLMSESRRIRAQARLRECATKALKYQREWLKKLEDAWREFPECERDTRIPSPEEVLQICDRMDADAERDKQFCEMMRNMGAK